MSALNSTSSLVNVAKESREKCAQNQSGHFASLHVEIFIIAKTNNLENPDEITKENTTDEFQEDPALDNSDSLLRVLTNLYRNLDHMAGSLSPMGEAFAALSKQRSTKRDARSGNLDPLNGETKKPRVDAVKTGDESDDLDVQELLATKAENDSEGAKTSSAKMEDSCNNEGEDNLLKKLALHFSKDDKVSSPTSKQLADINNKR